MTSRNSESGFTLMEMLVVIAIMGLVLAMVTAFGPPRSQEMELRAAAAQVAQAMRAAHGRAIASGQNVTLALPALPQAVTATMTPKDGMVFAPDGSAGPGQVVLRDAGREADITADWLTGTVRIDAR